MNSRGIESLSKKIKKLNLNHSTMSSTIKKSKDKTFPKIVRVEILKSLWMTLHDLHKLDLTAEDFSPEDLLKLINNTDLTSYNKVLSDILMEYTDPFQGKGLTDWRKKIKDWVESAGKSERRGAPISAEDFRDELLKILKSLPYRCFKTLQLRIIGMLRILDCETREKACSKHWWFNVLRQNSNLREIWKNLPLERQQTGQYSTKQKTKRSLLLEVHTSSSFSPEVDHFTSCIEEDKSFGEILSQEMRSQGDLHLIEWDDSIVENLLEEGFFMQDELEIKAYEQEPFPLQIYESLKKEAPVCGFGAKNDFSHHFNGEIKNSFEGQASRLIFDQEMKKLNLESEACCFTPLLQNNDDANDRRNDEKVNMNSFIREAENSSFYSDASILIWNIHTARVNLVEDRIKSHLKSFNQSQNFNL